MGGLRRIFATKDLFEKQMIVFRLNIDDPIFCNDFGRYGNSSVEWISGGVTWRIKNSFGTFIIQNPAGSQSFTIQTDDVIIFRTTKQLLVAAVAGSARFDLDPAASRFFMRPSAGRDWTLNFISDKFAVKDETAGKDRTVIRGSGHISQSAVNATPPDAEVETAHIVLFLDETGNKLRVKARYSNGTTIKTGDVATLT